MVYTNHGHHIPGTVMSRDLPAKVARCGGPGICSDCSRESISLRRDSDTKDILIPLTIVVEGKLTTVGIASSKNGVVTCRFRDRWDFLVQKDFQALIDEALRIAEEPMPHG